SNASAAPEKTARICAALGFAAGAEETVRAGALAFCAGLGLDMRLRAYGVPSEDLPVMAAEAHGIRRLLDWNPRDLSVAEIEAIYRRAY
ncbi:iron-containing alcohol dehydrogenase, partial [Rhodovulum sulfidophilum]|nr:iron-containing alcohol dehydrogenase [Rhodovulum sulfidophilum]